ncbi:uncharacterized protein [Lepeophtheirus salmonis]|uniref:uncharacterized protein n=1 Tax=Lepeophtheirus salmonis TaxID=72036 RepID=UPI001AE6ECBB|nr:titin-like [Lepeophtheirus salmonis]XP_040583354.1 titin-like [Lepeophtheirus salmonis]XP_040583355.1 titin-like [Lepeophtheirus salmonis]XP_040583356.1 titin-like [Lepeophtheirus salmonis]XP_040583357.1 titin-like [Lepeophtheirus salmonis]XP_040583358.1 titin-like [Lepeophtheirus salmonis]
MTATTKFESTAISLPRPVPAHGGRDAEEGEISDGLEEGEEVFSDISDEDFESNYGRSGIKKDFKDDKMTLAKKKYNLGSSMVGKNTENELVDDFEDVDEDILYLRLMALRSMIPSSDTPTSNKSPISSKSIEDEMEELLEEADKAAAQSSIPPPPIIDIADSDEEKMDLYIKTMTTNMSFLAPIKVKEELHEPSISGGPLDDPNLQYLVMKLKRSLENGGSIASSNQEQEDSFYSPTQSPVHMSPPSSPDVIPLPPERVLKPPGDDEYIENKAGPLGQHQPVDMELGSENEAEIQFFKHQKEIPSVVGWPPHQLLCSGAMSVPNLTPQMLYNCDHYLYQESMYQEELNSICGNKKNFIKAVTAKPPPPPPPILPSTTPTTSKSKKRIRKRKSTIKFISTSDEEENAQVVQTKRRITPPPPQPPPPVVPINPIDSDDEEAMRAHLLSTMAAKRNAAKNEVDAVKKVTKQVEKAKTEKQPPLKILSKPVKKSLSKLCVETSTEMPFDKLKKYFPNMVRPFIIPLNIPPSSEDESTSTMLFQANLDLFMKNAREDSCTIPRMKRIPPPKPVRKNPPRSKVSATALLLNNKTNPIRKRYISMIEKESLKTRSSIEHLPIERQKEYKMLLARIAVKEKKQQLENSKKDIEDPEEMRKLLISKMKNLKSKIDKNKIDLKKKVLVESKENNEPKNIIEDGGSNVPEKIVNESVVSSEKDLIQSRNEVVSELFKLSAQLSQFKNESEKLITAQNFLSDLMKQVSETKKLIKKKKERIAQLRNVVKLSHHSITKKRRDLSVQESQCKKLGETLIGEAYELPSTGSEKIKHKLVQIASNAKLCKKANLESARSEGVSSSKNDDDSVGVDGDVDDSPPQKKEEISGVSSSIAHLKSGDTSIDPHQEFCRFELLGKCNDDACPYQHHKSVS